MTQMAACAKYQSKLLCQIIPKVTRRRKMSRHYSVTPNNLETHTRKPFFPTAPPVSPSAVGFTNEGKANIDFAAFDGGVISKPGTQRQWQRRQDSSNLHEH
jgi:hypothetical protein